MFIYQLINFLYKYSHKLYKKIGFTRILYYQLFINLSISYECCHKL